ncbi:hypothetical protein [Nonomuraea dietziae]
MLTRAAVGSLRGPAIIEDPESTIVVPPGWGAALSPDGSVTLTGEGGA